MATYQIVVTVELERLDGDNAMAWRGNAKHIIVGTLPELQAAELTPAHELAQQLVNKEIERNAG